MNDAGASMTQGQGLGQGPGQGPGWHHIEVGLLRVTGADRLDLLHRLSTQDLQPLRTVGAVTDTLFTTAQGRVIAWVRVYSLADALWISCDAGTATAATLAAWIQRYTIMEDVTVDVCTAPWCQVQIWGTDSPICLGLVHPPQAHTWLPARLGAPQATKSSEPECLVTPVLPAWGAGLAALVPRSQLATLVQRCADHQVPACSAAQYELRRLLAGVPSPQYELQGDAVNPLEMRLADSAIHWHKGCYIGQEVISRLHSYNKVARLLMGFAATGTLPAVDDGPLKLYRADRPLGRVTSWAAHDTGFVGLALVKREAAAATPDRHAVLRPGELTVALVDRPFWPTP